MSNGQNISDLFDARNVPVFLRAAGSLDEGTREALAEAFRLLGNSLREAVPGWIDRTASDIRLRVTGERQEAPLLPDREEGEAESAPDGEAKAP